MCFHGSIVISLVFQYFDYMLVRFLFSFVFVLVFGVHSHVNEI